MRLRNPFKKQRTLTLNHPGHDSEVIKVTSETKKLIEQIQGEEWPEKWVGIGSHTLTKANAAKVEVLHNLLGLLDNDDVDSVFVSTYNAMALRGIRFKAPVLTMLTQLEVANQEK